MGAECYELLVNLCTPDKPKSKTYVQITDIMKKHLQPKPSPLAERNRAKLIRNSKFADIMPKKQPRNAFYFYMLDLKEEQRKKGVQYANMAEVAAAAGPLWTQAPPAIRRKFEDMAKAEKQKHNVPEQKFTSTGVSLAEIQRQALELQEAEENERHDIKNFVKLKSFNKSILREDIYLMDVNFYCKAGAEYLIGESTILRFNLEEGIKDSYHELINPGGIPVGYTLDVKLGCQEYGLEMPDDGSKRSNYIQILANSIDYLKQKNRNLKSLPPIFTMPEKVAPITDFIQQMCSRAAEDDSLFRIYKLDTLFFTLINSIRTQEHEGFPKESLALAQLNKYKLKYEPGLACDLHEASEKSMECTTSRTKRWAFIILDSCCPVVGIEAVPGRHVPFDYDMDSIQTYKEQKRERATTVQGSVAGSVCGSVNTSLNDSARCHSEADTSRSEKRKHAPLRMPNTDYSQTLKPAPELTETNFPSLSAGRGRGLAGSFNKMKIGK